MLLDWIQQIQPTILNALFILFGIIGVYMACKSYITIYRMVFKRDQFLQEQQEIFEKLQSGIRKQSHGKF